MNQSDVTELARQAGGVDLFVHGCVTWTNTDTPEFLIRFANLVDEKQRVKSSEVCLQVKYDPCYKVRETFAAAIRKQHE